MATDEFSTLSHHPQLSRAYELTIGEAPDDKELAEIFDPEVEIDFSGREVRPRVYKGFGGVRELLADLRESLDDFKFEVEEIREAGDSLVAYIHTRGRLPGSGEPVSQMPAHVWTMAGGRIRSGRYFADRQEALGSVK